MTCTIIGLVVACSGAPVQTSPAQSLALVKAGAIEIVEAQTPDRPAGVTRPNTPEEALAIMRQHETKIVPVDIPYGPYVTGPQPQSVEMPRRRFGESPWWWSELYSPW
jgi:hypothetical protein